MGSSTTSDRYAPAIPQPIGAAFGSSRRVATLGRAKTSSLAIERHSLVAEKLGDDAGLAVEEAGVDGGPTAQIVNGEQPRRRGIAELGRHFRQHRPIAAAAKNALRFRR